MPDVFDKLPDWAQLLVALVILAPVLLGYIAKAVVAWRQFKRELDAAREQSIWAAAEYLWSEGQEIKARLEAYKGRGDFAAELRDKAYAAAAKHGLPAELVDVLLERARVVHKRSKGAAPALVEEVHPDPRPGPGSISPVPGPSSTVSSSSGSAEAVAPAG